MDFSATKLEKILSSAYDEMENCGVAIKLMHKPFENMIDAKRAYREFVIIRLKWILELRELKNQVDGLKYSSNINLLS